MRSNRPSAVAARCTSHASHTPRAHQTWCSHEGREACDARAAAAADGRFDRVIAHALQNRAQ
eukprot:9024266-Lingulodinium_polyedra.AAC.1